MIGSLFISTVEAECCDAKGLDIPLRVSSDVCECVAGVHKFGVPVEESDGARASGVVVRESLAAARHDGCLSGPAMPDLFLEQAGLV